MDFFRKRSYNLDAALKSLLLLGYAFFFFLTMQSGQILKYVHPRNVPVIIFAGMAMVICAVFFMKEALKPKRVLKSSKSLLLFAVPLVMAFLVPAQKIDSTVLSYDGINIGGAIRSGNNITQNVDSTNSLYGDDTIMDGAYDEEAFYREAFGNMYSDGSLGTADQNATISDEGFQVENGVILVDDQNYVKWMEEIHNHLDKYRGKKIQVTGFVYKDDAFGKNAFVSARMLMVCCAADMQTIGFLCKYKNVSDLPGDSWVKVTGTIQKETFEGDPMTVIVVDQIENTKKPENEYVYPF